ncbi:dynein axonemal assembly factor 4-like isoform X1 [Linepithema humile]|uniref:dynein axonemal assembly factor 4-like isoform X1 n=1 Tax=Linepithema humile TaxID=83485 RepID=UPI00351F30AE
MPIIIIKDYQWRQTEKKIIIYIPLKGCPKNVDLFAMDNYVKISFPPFILELFLWKNVLEEESECTLTDTEAIFSLQKEKPSKWPNLEMENISKEQKCELRNRILKKAQSVSESRAKSKSEKRQHLQKEAVKVQINLDTDILNKIESLRDSHRRAAMQDFEEWRSNAEMPILQDISGKTQENRKAYRCPLKWFKDDFGIVQSEEIDTKEKMNEEVEVEKRHELIKELKDGPGVVKNPKREVAEDTKKELINRENRKEMSIIEKELRKELNIEKKEKSFNLEKSSTSEDSESDYETVSSTNALIKKMDRNSLQKFAKTKKQRSEHDLIDKILKNRYSRINQIFDEPAKTIPLPRKSATINITFSERVFPTPARESSHAEEQEWLSKQAEARRKTGFVVEDLRPEEQDPQWLKDKGEYVSKSVLCCAVTNVSINCFFRSDFFKAGNYLAAISAYTHGIKISDKMTTLYVNRSAAHYAIGNYYRCIDDSSKALELMEPKCESNRVSRARCHARRGAALCKLSAPQHGIPELETALELDPNNESIKNDLYAVRQYFDIKK